DEAGVADRELPRHAVDDVQRERDDDVHHREQRELPPRGVGHDGFEAELEADHDRDEERDREESARRLLHGWRTLARDGGSRQASRRGKFKLAGGYLTTRR